MGDDDGFGMGEGGDRDKSNMTGVNDSLAYVDGSTSAISDGTMKQVDYSVAPDMEDLWAFVDPHSAKGSKNR